MTTAARRSSDAPPPYGTRMSDEQWVDMDEDAEGELVDGILVEEEMPNYPHEAIVAWLCQLFLNWLGGRGGTVGSSGAKFLLRRGLGRKPDVSVYFPGRELPPEEGGVTSPPDVLIEIISKRARDVRRDRIEKMQEYAAFGVRSYWLVEPKAHLFEIYVRNERGRYEREIGASRGKIESVPHCEGMTIDLDALWKRVDAFGIKTPKR